MKQTNPDNIKLTAIIYQSILAIFRILPFKKLICQAIKTLKIPHRLFYRDFKFKGNFKVKVDIKKYFHMIHQGVTIENETFWNGLFTVTAKDTGWLWKQLCGFSDVIIDIGANTGIYSLVAETINPGSKIYAFEPSNNTFYKLRSNAEINKFDIVCEKIALSNSDKNQIFYDSLNPNQTSASLSSKMLKDNESYNEGIKEYDVKCSRMSTYIQEKNIKKIDLIKIDVEMHEPEVMEGFGHFLEEFKPVVLIEVLSDEVAGKLNNMINPDEYIIFHLKDFLVAERSKNFYAEHGEWNFVFFHKDLEEKIKSHTTLYNAITVSSDQIK